MENILISTQISLEPGQCLSKFNLSELGIQPTNIDCFEYNHYQLYKNGRKRYVIQPLPYEQFKIIKVYDFVPARYS